MTIDIISKRDILSIHGSAALHRPFTSNIKTQDKQVMPTPQRFRRAVPEKTDRSIMDRLKEHPIWLFGSGVAAASAFVVTIFIPMTTSYLTSQIEIMKPAHERLKATEAKVESLSKELVQAKAERDEALQKNPFTGSSVYPTGLGTIVLGSPLARVYEVHPKVTPVGDDEKKPDYLTATTDHPIFGTVAFYPTNDKQRKVSSILYLLKRNSVSPQLIHHHFTQTFGPPKAESKGRAYWNANSREVVEVGANGSVYITKAPDIPLWAQR